MKINRLLILSIFALAIMTIGAVGASDNATDEAVSLDSEDALAEVIPHSLEGDDWPSDIEINFNSGKDEVLKDEPVYFSKTRGDGKMAVSIDGKQKTATIVAEDEVDARYSVPTTGLALGEHILNVKVTGGSYFNNVNRNFTFFIRDIVVDVPKSVDLSNSYGNDMTVLVNSVDAGDLTVVIDGKTVEDTKVSKTTWTRNLNKLSASTDPHIIKVTYKTAKGLIYNKTFAVNVAYFSLSDMNITYDNPQIRFFLPAGFSKDKVRVKIDGKEYNVNNTWQTYNVEGLDNLDLGSHSLVVSYDGDSKFNACSLSAVVTIYPKIYFTYEGILTFGENVNVNTRIPASNSTLTVYVDGKLYKSMPFNNYGSAHIDVSGLKVGAHKIRADITGDYNYTYTKGVYVDVDINWIYGLDVGETDYYIVKYPNATGKITADFGGKKVTAQFVNGTATVAVPTTLKVGYYDVCFIYEGENPFNVSRGLSIDPVFHVPKSVTNGKANAYMTLPYDDPAGKFVIEVYNKKDRYVLSAKFNNGKATIPLDKINAGTYTIFPKYFDGKEWYYHGVIEGVKVKNTKLTASNLVKYYGDAKAFKVKVADYNGKLIKNKYVKFYINGKYVKKVKTNKKGIATLKIAKAPGSYEIKAKYGKVEITRTLTVKHVVSLKSVKVKRSASKLTLKATLKQGKKALKNKKVTFKFNGKTYKAKTNKKGVAKVTIKKSVLKKLKVGKTVKYQVKYLRDTVKKSAIVAK